MLKTKQFSGAKIRCGTNPESTARACRRAASALTHNRAISRRLVSVKFAAGSPLEPRDAGDVLMVRRLDRLAQSRRDLLNSLAAMAGRKAGFTSLGDR